MTHMTIELFRQIYDGWKRSGLSVQQYCKYTDITAKRFYYWRSKLKAESLQSPCGSFIPVKMSGVRPAHQIGQTSEMMLCEVEYPNGVTVRVANGMTLGQLRQMVTLLN